MSIEYKGENFNFENADYEVIPVAAERGYEVRVSRNNKPVPWKYSVDFQIATDFRRHVGEDAVIALVKLAKDHIQEKRFDELLVLT